MQNGPLFKEEDLSPTIVTAPRNTSSFSTTLTGITVNDTQTLEEWIQNTLKELRKDLDSKKAKTVTLSLNVFTSDAPAPK